MKILNKLFKTIIRTFAVVLTGGLLVSSLMSHTFSATVTYSPDVLITINSDGSIGQEGNLFSGELYPSTVSDAEKGIGGVSGVIRIKNEYRKVDIDNLAVGLNNLTSANDYNTSIVFDLFIKHVKLKIEKYSMLSFDKTLIDNISLEDILLKSDDNKYQGYTLNPDDKFSINSGDVIDLKYSLYMDMSAGNELQSITAHMPIIINFADSHIVDDGDNDEEDDTKNDNNDSESGNNSNSNDNNPINDNMNYEEYNDDNITLIDDPVIPLDTDKITGGAEFEVLEDDAIPLSALPNTGYALNTTLLIIIGALMAGTGLIIIKKA